MTKEKKLESQLLRKDGIWNIENMTYKYYAGGQMEYSESYANIGTMEFNKNGSFRLTLNAGGASQIMSGTWRNTKDEIIVIVGSETILLKVEKQPKQGEMKLQQVTNYPETDEKEVYTYDVSRKK